MNSIQGRCKSMMAISVVAAIVVAFPLPRRVSADPNWPQWRGPRFDGQSPQSIPAHWDDDSVIWKTELPGNGQSTPIIWGDRVFLTSSSDDGRRRMVIALDRHDGVIVWQKEIECSRPNVKHNMNSYASASCATDGHHVVAFFGRGGIHCFDLAGSRIWSRDDLGDFAGPWGTAASPAIVGDLVVQNCDADEDACLIALDKFSGKTVWNTRRDNYRGWSTPILITANRRQEIVLNGHRGVRGYDPATGKELWFCQGFNGRGSPTPLLVNGLLIVINGLSGDIYSVRPGGNGNVTETHMAWHTRRSGRDLPSPVVVGRFLFTVSLRGMATCYDVNSGEELWKERLSGRFAASPIAADGLIQVPNEDGLTFVIRPAERLDVVTKNQLKSAEGQLFRASLVPHQGQILVRSNSTLYCVGDKS